MLQRSTAKIVNLPNIITATRVAAVPVLFFLLSDPSRGGSLIIAVLFAIAMITDLFDGYLARRYDSVTPLGRFMDPIADKLLINTAMIILVSLSRLDAWVASLMIIRDFLVEGARATSASEGKLLAVSPWGKKKTFAQSIALTALIIHYPLLGLNSHSIGMVLIYIALAISLCSGIAYLRQFYRLVIKK
ncbi:MAG: CDP-diacylglycerol--glycerol-3-phosphate 3-phosphatidyltransferase [Deltaproteobacteria bacterium]|nr:CDP-diacylglycerol--glycerol-3-phosphate 3-phosphatidyltransferase [Deltaproteobacteria bacterium]